MIHHRHHSPSPSVTPPTRLFEDGLWQDCANDHSRYPATTWRLWHDRANALFPGFPATTLPVSYRGRSYIINYYNIRVRYRRNAHNNWSRLSSTSYRYTFKYWFRIGRSYTSSLFEHNDFSFLLRARRTALSESLISANDRNKMCTTVCV